MRTSTGYVTPGYWSDDYAQSGGSGPILQNTIISQFANSPTLTQLIFNMNEYIDPRTDFDNFYDFVWNVSTAQKWGLDIWGRIVNVSRNLLIPSDPDYLGFAEAADFQPFGQAPFYSGAVTTQTFTLSDDAYRTLIMVKALANISACTVPSLNQLLQNLFKGRGRCYVTDTGNMQMRYTFEFALQPFELAIMTQSGAVPRPAGVLASVLQVDLSTTFGFAESGDSQPFGSGVFFTSSGITNVGI